MNVTEALLIFVPRRGMSWFNTLDELEKEENSFRPPQGYELVPDIDNRFVIHVVFVPRRGMSWFRLDGYIG